VTEADVVITDYLLAAESVLFAWFLSRRPAIESGMRLPFVVFFLATGVGSMVGGTVHGFFLSDSSLLGVVLWRSALLSIGVAAVCGWTIGARLLFGARLARAIRVGALVESVAYAVVIIGEDDSFRVAVTNYLPSTVFLMVAFAGAYRNTREPEMVIGVAGLALTVVAAAIQQFRVALHPLYFNHNALYHAIQAAALVMIFRSARSLVDTREDAVL
jgi:hypothetical protein